MRPPRQLRGRAAGLAAGLALVVAAAAAAQAIIGPGFELERAGRLDQAADFYLATARAHPTDLAALLGLERVLPQLGRLREVLPLAQHASQLEPENAEFRGLLLRLYVALSQPDSARSAARQWARAQPRDAGPYREWALALEEVGANAAARDVLLAGRQALGDATALAVELAEVRRRMGEWEGAAREWATALAVVPAQLSTAVGQLVDAPVDRREGVIQVLTGASDAPAARQLGAALLLSWGDPQRAWAVFEPTVSGRSVDAAYALRSFADWAMGQRTRAGWRVRGLALRELARRVPPELAVRMRADAARAFLEAGDVAAAQAELALVAADPRAAPDAQRLAQATLIRALIQAGQLDSAAAQLERARNQLLNDDRTAVGLALARARIRRGDLARADSALGADSSVEASAVRGWIALYRGDLQAARALFRAAGPYAGDRRDATERMAMVALMQRIPEDRLPALGSALLALARGDSTGALATLRRVADRLTPEYGRPDVLLLAGRVAAGLGGDGERTAAALFDEVIRIGGTGAAAPAAELAWARMLLRQGETSAATQHLEHLILTYPESAVVPQARRELERARGAIPKS